MASLQIMERLPGLWRLRVRIHGKDRYEHVRGDRAAAELAGAAFKARLEDTGVGPALPGIPLRGWIAQQLAQQTHLERRTRERYEEVLRLHVYPQLGATKLSRLTASRVEAWKAELLDSGVRVPTVREATRLLRAFVRLAAKKRVLAADPLTAVDLPRRRRSERLEAQAARTIAPGKFPVLQAMEPGTKRGTLIRLALASGARRGELLALTWEDLDLEAGTVRIGAALEQTRDGAVRRKQPKNPSSIRTLRIGGTMVEELRAWRARCAAAALAAGLSLDACPVFPGRAPGEWWSPRAASRTVVRALRNYGLEQSLHSTRHAHATTLLSSRVNPVAVQRRLGHLQLQTTLATYGHALPQDDEAAVAALELAIAGPARQGRCL